MTFEVVLDNSKMLANCFEEAPLESFTLDLPGWYATYTGDGAHHNEQATPDTSSEIVINPDWRIAPEYFAETDQGDSPSPVPSNVNIFLPTTPDGYVLTEAKYVVIAYREANDGAAAVGYTGYVPTPTTVPFLYCESSGVTDGTASSMFVFNDIPVGGYAGETICSNPEIMSRITGAPGSQVPANRLWNDDFRPGLGDGTTPIHVAYFALRLYYNPA